jgi:hypothetical protein
MFMPSIVADAYATLNSEDPISTRSADRELWTGLSWPAPSAAGGLMGSHRCFSVTKTAVTKTS